MDLHIKDIVELKKTHPCGSKQWELTRVGMDIKLRCLGCGHELMLPRSRVEKSIKKIIPAAERGEGGNDPKKDPHHCPDLSGRADFRPGRHRPERTAAIRG